MKTHPAPKPSDEALASIFTPEPPALTQPTAQFIEAERRVQWRHFKALLDAGIPARDLIGDQHLTFGIVTIHGREMLVTDDARLRSYLHGPALFAMP